MLDDLVYIINDGGVLLCLDTTSGEVVKRGRLTGATGQYYASPVSDGKKLLLANLAGQMSLVEAGREWKSLSTLDLEESIVATPSLHNGKLYVRTATQLYCFDALKSK
jgi:outer membrane protein assembly factor BamB